MLVTGPAGIGKTTLIEQSLPSLEVVPVVRGYCPADPAPPLWPWRAALRRAGIEIQDALDVEAAAAWSARFAALARMSDALTHGDPSVIVLEDLHWADSASLDLLEHVVKAADPGLTVIGTVRSPVAEGVGLRLAALDRYGGHDLAPRSTSNAHTRSCSPAARTKPTRSTPDWPVHCRYLNCTRPGRRW